MTLNSAPELDPILILCDVARRVQEGIPFGSRANTCPVKALSAWLDASGIQAGPIFRVVYRHGKIRASRLTDQAVALIVKAAAEAASFDPARFSGHSPRAGLATSAASRGASERSIMAQTGRRSVQMVRKYIRAGSLFQENAATAVGL